MPETGAVTRLLLKWRAGDEAAFHDLMELVYRDLRRRADAYLRRERSNHTLAPTGLVHETYLKLVGEAGIPWSDRAHFFAVAARAMRQILVDHARKRSAAKRGGAAERVTLSNLPARGDVSADLVALDAALERLAALDPVQARLVELRYFGGLTIEETADVLGSSPATVKRAWASARAFLFAELSGA
ncbi:MAG: sigma-70 family RNA polymerase sigma factor [Thermoanaerobaculia bacterium]